MKYVVIILFLFYFSSRLYAQDFLEVSFETDLKYEGGDRFVEIDIYLKPNWDLSQYVGALELKMDINDNFFNAAPTDQGNTDFSFYTYDAEWSDLTYWPAASAEIAYVAPRSIAQISRMLTPESQRQAQRCWRTPQTCPLVLQHGINYKFGHISWKLLPTATGKLSIRIREYDVEYGAVSSKALDELDFDLPLQFVGDNIERDATGAACIVLSVDNPFETLDAPKDLAGNTSICGTPMEEEYTVTVPESVDSCKWYVSSDEAGEHPVGANVASIVVSEKGAKALVTWKAEDSDKKYYLQVQSVKEDKESDPIHLAVRIENFPDFAGSVTEKIACRSTELSWASTKDGMTVQLYPDLSENAVTSPYENTTGETVYFVRNREASACKDTIPFEPSFLDPKLAWLEAPPMTIDRGESFDVQVHRPTYPSTLEDVKIEYIWSKPEVLDRDYTAYRGTAVNKTYEFEVYAEVNGCKSDTLIAKTTVDGGGIKPMLSSESEMDIACDGGVQLKSLPDGGSGNYSYKWYANAVSGTPLATTSTVWVTPTKNTTYYVVVKDETTGEEAQESLEITYKPETSPVISAGEDQRIVAGTYTYLPATIVKDGASSNYTWNWLPADKLEESNVQNAQTVALAEAQKFSVYVVNTSGCMSKPDTVEVMVDDDLDPDLKPEDPDEDFVLAVVPGKVELCKNNTVQFDIEVSGINLQGATYAWTPASGLSDEHIANPLLTATDDVVSGDYFVTITKDDFKIVRKVTVTVNTSEEAPVLRLAENRMKCTGDVVQVLATGMEPDQYVWMLDGTEIEYTGDSYTLVEPGTHVVTVYGKNDGAACASDTLSVSATFGEGVILTDLTSDMTICGSETELSFTSITPEDAAFKWLKSDNSLISDTEKSISIQESGEYRLVKGSGVCTDTARIQVKLNNVLSVKGLKPVITGCQSTAELAFESTTAPSFIWLDPQGNELADSKDKNPYSVDADGIYQLRLDGGDCEETYSVVVLIDTKPIVNDVKEELTTCGEELELVGSASEGTLYWAEDREGKKLITSGKLTGSNETKTYYVFADAGEGCKGEVKEVQVSFGSTPKVLTELVQTTCDVPYTLRASTTGTGSVKWYDSATSKTPISDLITTAADGTSREYWACAEDDETCMSERVKVLVKFGAAPLLEANALQTTCGTELQLQATTTGGELVWKEAGSDQQLLLTQVSGLAGEVKHYEVYAADGACISDTKTVEVRFGSNPEVLANSLYTTCGNQFTLTGSASGGTLTWYSDASAKKPLSSLVVNKGTADVATYYAQATDATCKSPIKDVRVAFGTDPYVEALTPQTACKSDTPIALKATTTGGQLVWESEDGTKLSSVLVNKAGTYYVYAEDGSCKSTKESVEVKFGTNPVITVELTQTACGKEYTLMATTSGGTLHWYDSQSSDRQEINTLVTGSTGTSKTFYVKAVDGTCESEEKEVLVKFGTNPIVTVATDMTTCERVFKLPASTTGGSLYWKEKASGKLLPTPQVSGIAGTSVTYTVSAQDGSCTSKTLDVTVHYGDKPQLEVMTLQTACENSHMLLAEADGEIKWFEKDQETELTNLEVYGERGKTSTYWVCVEKDGCKSDMTEVTVAFGELPVVEVLTPQTTCGTSLTLKAIVSGGTAVWKKMDGSELTDLTVSGMSGVTDTYYVYAEDGSCKGAEEKVEVQFGTVPQVIVEKDITTCEEEYELKAEVTDAQATIHWLAEDKQTPVTFAKGSSGSSKKFYVYASTAECEGPMTEVTVHFGASPLLTVMPITTCDTFAILTAQSSVSDLIWTDASGKELLSTQVHGSAGTSQIYYVQAKDGRCESQQEAVRVSFGTAPELIVEEIQTVCKGDQYELQAQATGKADVVWYQADGVTQLTSTTVVKTGSSAIYYVEAREGACVGDKKLVNVLFDQEPLLELEKELQTTCGTLLTLQADASAGEVVWMREDGTVLDLPQVSGTAGTVEHYYAYAQDGTCESVKKTVEVRFGVSPEVDVNEVQTACGESHTLTAVASDGVLHWLEADKQTELASAEVTGSKGSEKTYYVYAENGEDCRSELYPVTVMFGTSPMLVDLLNPQTSCGTAVQLTAQATAGTVEWRDAQGNLLKTPLVSQSEPGEYTYYAQAKDETCVGASQEVTVKFGARPEVVAESRQTTCDPSSYTIVASATEGVVHYLASDQRTELKSGTVTKAGTYYVYAKALDCVSDTLAVEVELGTKPEILLDEETQSTCEDILQLQASATGGNLYWEKVLDNGDTEPLLIPQIAATEGVTMCYVYAADSREDESCRSEKERINLKFGAKPTVIAEDFQTTCAVEGYELQASASDGDLYWLEQDGVTPLNSTTVSGEANTLKTYWVYAEQGSCSSDRQEITVAFGVPPIVTVADTLTSCDTKITLSATTSAGTLTWLNEKGTKVTNLTISNVTKKPATYYVYATDGECESVKHKVVTVPQTNPLVFVESLQTTCEPENYELKATASDGTLHWLDSEKNPLTSTVISGKRGESLDYYVYAEKTDACKSKEYKVTVEFGVAPMLEVFSPQTLCGSGEVMLELQAAATGGKLVWEDEDGNRLASTQQKATAPKKKYYYVHAEDNSCTSVTEKVEVRFGGTPVVLTNELQTTCGESLTLDGTATSGSLIWSDGKKELTSLTVTPAQGDTYYVKAQESPNCESPQTTVQVAFNTLPMVEVVTPQTTCGTQLQLKAEATDGQLVWLNANGDKLNLTQVSGTQGTKATYFVYAEGNGCEGPQELVEVEFGTLPQVIVEENQTACGTSHVLTGVATDGELVWLDAAKKPLTSTTVTGKLGESKDYYVYAKAIDCESEPQKVTVHFGQLPIVSVKDLQTTCETALTLEASTTAGKIVWTAEDGSVLPAPIVTGNKGENAYYYATAEDGSCHSTTERVEVRFGSEPEVLLASDIVTTCGSEYNLEAEASSGVVNWYASKESVVKLTSTLVQKPENADYAVYYAQAQNGTCVGEKQKVTVVFGSKPLVSVTTPMSSCDTVLVLSAQTTGGELVWMNGSSELLATPSVHGASGSVGRYYVQAKDGSCQSEIKEIYVNFGTSPSLNVLTEQTSCETKMELQATATGGSVYWLKSDKQPLASTHVEGAKGTSARYYVYAADGACVGDTVEVKVAFGADPKIDVVDLQTSCNDAVELQATTSGGSLQWTNEAGDVILPAVATKPADGDQLICYVQAIDGTCTTERKPVTVRFGATPEVFAESLQTSCENECTLVATASAGNVVWEDEKHRVLSSATVSGTGMNTYYVYASVGRNCASEKKQIKVAFATDPIVTVVPLQTSCGEVVELKATASAGTLVWTNENGRRLTDTKVTPEMGSTYQVYAQDGKCKSVEQTVEVSFGVNPTITAEPLQTTCGTSLQLKASASGGNIVWVNEDSEPISSTITSAGGNAQTVFVYAEDGSCMSDEVVEVQVKFGQRPTLHDLENTQKACDSPYQLQAASTGGSIVWLRNGKEIAGNWVDLEEGENVFFVHVEDASCTPVASTDEKVTVTLGNRPELTLSTTRCVGDTIYAEEANAMENLVYRWFVNGTEDQDYTSSTYVFADGGEYTLQVVAETENGCVSDTATVVYQIADPLRIAWDSKPAASVGFGNNIAGCVKVVNGETEGVTWNWLSPSSVSGSCLNMVANDPEYEFEVYAVDQFGCSSDTATAFTKVTGFGVLDVTLVSESGTEICVGGSAVLTAEVRGGQAPYTYEWYVDDNKTPIQTKTTSASINVLTLTPDAAATYTVKVRDSQLKPAIANKKIDLTMKEATLPVADAGPDMTIQRGLQTLLKPANGDDITAWRWLPIDKLAANEEAEKQYPLTATLSTSQKYQLFVTNSEGCVSLPDDVVVFVLPLDGTEGGDIPTPPVSEGLNLAIQPSVDTLCLGTERWIAVKDLLGNLSSKVTYTWVTEPSVSLKLNTKRDSALFTPDAAGDYTFSVFVEDGGKKMALRSNIRVNDSQAPRFELAVTGDCQQDTVKVTYEEGTLPAAELVWKVKGTTVANEGDYYVLSAVGSYTVEVRAQNGGCSSDVKTVDVTVNAAPAITELAMVDSCGQAVIEVTATGATEGYSWTTTSEGKTEGDNRYVITEEGEYQVTVVASNGICSVERTLAGEVYSRPQLQDWVTEPMDVAAGSNITAAVSVQTGGKADFTYHWLQPKDSVTLGAYTQLAELANYTFEVYASDANGCTSDTLKKSVAVTGGKIIVDIVSVYGKEICQGGAAMLVAHAQGAGTPCLFEWSKVGTSGYVRSAVQNAEYDTLWIEASKAGNYQVAVREDAASKILASAQIEGLTVSESLKAPVVTTEAVLTIPQGSHTVLLAEVSEGAPAYQWHWSPAGQLAILADTAVQYPKTANLEAKQEFRVYVTDAESCVSVLATTLVDVDDEHGLCVELAPQTAEVCHNNTVNLAAVVSCGKPTDWDLEYSWEPSEQAAELLSATDRDSVVFTPQANGEYTWIVKVTNGDMVAAARATVTVKDAEAPLLTLQGRWDCVNDTLVLENSGEAAEKYVWTVDGIETAETGDRFVLTNADVKEVRVYAQAENGCMSDTATIAMQLGIIPDVQMSEVAFVSYPDSIHIIRIKQTDGLTDEYYDFTWTSLPDDRINGSRSDLSAITMPMEEDVKYTFVATSKNNPVCQATDTVWGYMIPKVAEVGIDKDEDTGDLYLSWNEEELGLADSVRIMNVKWDGYAVESAYEPLTMAAGGEEQYIINTAKDTLEFFYINASRYIPELGRSYYSLSSDTVGYFKQWLYANSGKTTSNNMISFPFVMNNVKDNAEFGTYIGNGSDGNLAVATIGTWTFEKQAWQLATYMKATKKWIGTTFEIIPGNIYSVVLQNTEASRELLTYGTLPPKYSYDFASTPAGKTTGNNYFMMPLNMYGINTRQGLGINITGVSTVATFNFTKQVWEIATYMSTTNKWIPSIESDKIFINCWMPIQAVVKEALLNWGK